LTQQVSTYTEFLAYSDILQMATRAKKLAMVEEFLHLSPHSPYAQAVRSLYLAILRDTDPQKALVIARKMIEERHWTVPGNSWLPEVPEDTPRPVGRDFPTKSGRVRGPLAG